MSQVWFPRAVRATETQWGAPAWLSAPLAPKRPPRSSDVTDAVCLRDPGVAAGAGLVSMHPSPGAQGGVGCDRWANGRKGGGRGPCRQGA